MQINIRILDLQIENRKTPKSSYKIATVDYKDLNDNKPGSRKVMSFGPSEAVFGYLAGHEVVGKEFTVTTEKINDYWNWTAITEGSSSDSGGSSSSPAVSSGAVGRTQTSSSGGDAERQLLIVRQNALTNALKFFEITAHKKATVDEVASLVEKFTDISFSRYTPDVDVGGRAAKAKTTDDVLDQGEDDIQF